MKLIYIAGKFTGPNAWEIAKNVFAAESAGADVALLGAMPVIPHKNTSNFHGLGTPEFWYAGTLELMRRCDAVYVFNHHHYETSTGTKGEVEEAKKLNIPFFIDLHDLKHWLKGGRTIIDKSGLHHATGEP